MMKMAEDLEPLGHQVGLYEALINLNCQWKARDMSIGQLKKLNWKRFLKSIKVTKPLKKGQQLDMDSGGINSPQKSGKGDEIVEFFRIHDLFTMALLAVDSDGANLNTITVFRLIVHSTTFKR